MVDRISNDDDFQRRRVRRAYKKVMEMSTPENFSLPVYVNAEISSETMSDDRSRAHQKLKKRTSLIYVDDRAAVANPDQERSPVGSESDDITNASIALSSSSSEQ